MMYLSAAVFIQFIHAYFSISTAIRIWWLLNWTFISFRFYFPFTWICHIQFIFIRISSGDDALLSFWFDMDESDGLLFTFQSSTVFYLTPFGLHCTHEIREKWRIQEEKKKNANTHVCLL